MKCERIGKPAAASELADRIQQLIQFKGGGHNESEVADIIENALKMLGDVKDTGDVRVIQTAVRELRYAFRIFAPYAHKRKVWPFPAQCQCAKHHVAFERARSILFR